MPTPGETATPQTGPGLALVAALSAAWGCFHAPAGKAVYFTLAFQTVVSDEEKTPTSKGEMWRSITLRSPQMRPSSGFY